MTDRTLLLIYRLLGRHRLERAMDGIPVLFQPEAVPRHTQHSMFLSDVPLYRLRGAVGAASPSAWGFTRGLDLIESRGTGIETIDLRELSGVTCSRGSHMSWAEFCREEGAVRSDFHGASSLGCASMDDAQRLLSAISLGDETPYPVTRVTWTGQLFWGPGRGGGSHRMAAVADWCHRTGTVVQICADVTEVSVQAKAARVLAGYRVGLLPLATADALAKTVRERTKVRVEVAPVDVLELYGRADARDIAVVGVPTSGAIARDIAALITARSDWLDLSDLLCGRA